MALLWVEGFENYGDVSANESRMDSFYNVSAATGDLKIREGRNGKSIELVAALSGSFTTPTLTTNTIFITGFAFKTSNINDSIDRRILDFSSASQGGSTVNYTALGLRQNLQTIKLSKFNSTLNTSGNVLSANTWHYMEVKIYSHTSNGTVNILLDGSEILSYTGNTVLYTYSPVIACMRFSCCSNITRTVDDWYICDGTGNTNNDFLGDLRVKTLVPEADITNNWTLSSGSDVYSLLNQGTLNTDKHISSNTAGQRAIVSLEPLTESIDTLYGAMVFMDAQLSANYVAPIKLLSQNGTGNLVTLNTVPCKSHTRIMENDPDDTPWTQNTVNTVRLGVEVG